MRTRSLNRSFDWLRVPLAIAMSATVLAVSASTPASAGQPETSDIGFSKDFAPDTIGPGSSSTLTFTIDAAEVTEPVTGLAFTDNFPSGLVIATPSSASTDCVDGILSAPDGGGTVSLSGGKIGVGEICTVSVSVTGTTTGSLLNLSGDLTSSDGNSGSASDTLTVDETLPGVSKDFSPSSIPLGATSTLTFTFDNSANDASFETISMIDAFPDGMEVATPANVATDCAAVGLNSTEPGSNTISIVGTLVGPETCTAEIDVTTSTHGTFGNVSEDLLVGPSGDQVPAGFASASLDVPVEPLSKVFLYDPVAPGGEVTLEFTILNPSRTDTATGLTFTDALPAGLGLASGPLPDPPCGAGSSLTGTTTLTLADGTLDPGDSCTFTVDLSVPPAASPGDYTNTTSTLTATIGTEPFETEVGATDELTIAYVPTFTKEFLDNPVGAGGTTDLKFTITNTNPDEALESITFVDEFDDVLPTASSVPSNPVCGGSLSYTPLSDAGFNEPARLTLTEGTIAPGEMCMFTLTLDVVTNATSGIYPNATSTISAEFCPEGCEPIEGFPATDDLEVVGGPVLLKEFLADPVTPDSSVDLQFTLTHPIPAPELGDPPVSDITGIAFSDDLDTALSGLVATGLPTAACGGTASTADGGMTIDFSGGSLTAGEVCSFTVALDVPVDAPPGSHTNTTTDVTATVDPLAVTGNPATDDLDIIGLTLEKAFTDDPVMPGDTVTLAFTISNDSDVAATDIVFSDDLGSPPGLGGTLPGLAVFGPLPDPAPDCGAGSMLISGAGGTNITFFAGSLAPMTSCSFAITLLVPVGTAAGEYINTSSDLGSSLGTFPPAIDTLDIEIPLPPLLTKEFTDDPVVPGDTVTLQFIIENPNDDETLESIAFTDDLAEVLVGLTAALPTDPDPPCGAASSVVLSAGDTFITFEDGELGPGESCTFSLILTVDTEADTGTFVNETDELTADIPDVIVLTGEPATDTLTVSALELDFSKSFLDDPVFPGGQVELEFTIANPASNAPTVNLQFNDDLAAVIPGLVAFGLPVADVCGNGSLLEGTSLLALTGASLAPGESCTFSVLLNVPTTATIGTFPNETSELFESSNVVGAPATDDLDIELPDRAGIELTKSPAIQAIAEGGVATWTILVENPTRVPLTEVAVTDDLAPDCDRLIGDLGPEAFFSYTCTLAGITDDFTNVANAVGLDDVGPVGATDSADVVVLPPGLEITKSPAEQTIDVGETASWTITVTNTGGVDLTEVEVFDPLVGDCDLAIGDLAAGDDASHDCELTDVTDGLVNVASVTGLAGVDELGDTSDGAAVIVRQPVIDIEKTPDTQNVDPGGTATFTILVTNTGRETLNDVIVSDPLSPNCDKDIGSLTEGAIDSYTCELTGVTDDFVNVATVTATELGEPVSDVDEAAVNVTGPDISIDKTPDVQTVDSGGDAVFTITVENTGDTPLTGVEVTDALAPDCDEVIGDMEVEAIVSYSCTLAGVTGPLTNVATVDGTAGTFAVSDSDTADVKITALTAITGARYADSRFGGTTFDGLFQATGPRLGGTTWEIQIAGRGDVPGDAVGAIANFTSTGASAPGYFTVFDCGTAPTASALNYTAGVDVANEVFAKLSATGSVCVFTSEQSNVLVDVVGFVLVDDSVKLVDAARVAESREGATTVDGLMEGFGRTAAGSTTEVQVAGRAGVPPVVSAVIVNVAAIDTVDTGFVTVSPCPASVPIASSINYVAGVNRANELIAEVDATGKICIYTETSIDFIVDVVGYVEVGSSLVSNGPTRFADSRPGGTTVDGMNEGGGPLAPGSTTEIQIAGRDGVSPNAIGVVANVAAVDPLASGYLTVTGCVTPTPNASSLNYTTGINGANELVVELSATGKLCVFTSAGTDVIVDVVGYL